MKKGVRRESMNREGEKRKWDQRGVGEGVGSGTEREPNSNKRSMSEFSLNWNERRDRDYSVVYRIKGGRGEREVNCGMEKKRTKEGMEGEGKGEWPP
jgi:hypothetical protein